MKELKTEARLVKKNRLCWTLIFFGAIIIGILFYALSALFGLTITFIIIIVFALVYTTTCELATKTMDMFWIRGTLLLPLGAVFSYVLNFLSPRYFYTQPDPNGYIFTFLLYMLLAAFCFFGGVSGTLIVRLVSGYEALAEEPKVISYLVKGKVDDVVVSLESFLDSLNVHYSTITTKDKKRIKFENGVNDYLVFFHSTDDSSIEVNFVVSRMKRETLIEPKEEEMRIFVAYLETFLNNAIKDTKIGDWTTKFEPKNAESMKIQVWESLTSPLRIKERLALRGSTSQRVIDFFASHKIAILTFIGGILTVVIGELLYNYLLKIMGF